LAAKQISLLHFRERCLETHRAPDALFVFTSARFALSEQIVPFFVGYPAGESSIDRDGAHRGVSGRPLDRSLFRALNVSRDVLQFHQREVPRGRIQIPRNAHLRPPHFAPPHPRMESDVNSIQLEC
jgi:hypothetical protein